MLLYDARLMLLPPPVCGYIQSMLRYHAYNTCLATATHLPDCHVVVILGLISLNNTTVNIHNVPLQTIEI